MKAFSYALMPIVAWLGAGTLKFVINFIRYRRRAFQYIGNGGFPSTHTTIVTSTVVLLGLREGFDTGVFGLGMAVLMLTVIDAMGIRRALGKHAAILNKEVLQDNPLRERQGHYPHEVLGGLIWGTVLALLWRQW